MNSIDLNFFLQVLNDSQNVTDEDASYNTGSYIIHGDDVQDNSPKDASPEAWKLVFDLGVHRSSGMYRNR